jgi:uncharacterized protein (TIGR02147 family)
MGVSSPARKPSRRKSHPAPTLPDVLEYADYRRFLADYYRARKASEPGFSLRALAQEAGFPSHGHLKDLMDGARNLSQKTLMKLVPALGLEGRRARYFENLVFFNQARTLREQRMYHDRLRAAPAKSGLRKLDASQLRAFRSWHTAAIREMIALKGFRADPDWIARKLLPRSDTRAVRDALEELLAAGLIRRTANGFRQAEPDVTTDDEIRSFHVRSYHADALQLAARALDDIPAADRDVSAVCFAIRGEDWPALKKRLQELRKELKALEAKPGHGDRLVQINLQAFPLTRTRGDG